MKVLRYYPDSKREYPTAIVEVGEWLLYLTYFYEGYLPDQNVTIDAGEGLLCPNKRRCTLEVFHYCNPFPKRLNLPLDGDPDSTFRKFLDELDIHLVEEVL